MVPLYPLNQIKSEKMVSMLPRILRLGFFYGNCNMDFVIKICECSHMLTNATDASNFHAYQHDIS